MGFWSRSVARVWIASCGLALLFAAVPAPAAGQAAGPDYFLPMNVLRFADSLLAEAEYAAAISEYKRYLMLAESAAAADRARAQFSLGLAFRLSGDVESAVSAFESAAAVHPDLTFVASCRLQIAYAYLTAGRWVEADGALKAAVVSPTDHRPLIENLQGARYLLSQDWKLADDHLALLGPQPSGNTLRDDLRQIAKDGLAVRRRSPWLAGALSAVVPGAGRVYAGRKADGFLSTIAVSMAAWQAYRGFRRDGSESIRGWIMGSVGTFLYVGNIYGSIVSVKLENERLPNSLTKRTGVLLSVAMR